jgi:hypothetical protein
VLNQTWALDFMTETLHDCRRVCLLTVIDDGNRQVLEIAIGVSLPSRRRPRAERARRRERPSDRGLRRRRPGVYGATLRRLVRRARCGDALHPAREAPDQTAYIERFNRS